MINGKRVEYDENKDVYYIQNEVSIDVFGYGYGISNIDHDGLDESKPTILLKLAIPGVLLRPPVISVAVPDILLDGTYEAEVQSVELPISFVPVTESGSNITLSEEVVGNRATGVISYIRKKLIKLLEEPS